MRSQSDFLRADYIVSDGNEFIWINPKTGNFILDENGKPVCKHVNPKSLSVSKQTDLSDFIDEISNCLSEENDQIIPRQYLDPTNLAKKTARILQNMALSSSKNSLYTFVEVFNFKFLSDIGILKGSYSFESIYQIFKNESAEDAFKQYLTTIRDRLLELFPTNPIDNTSIINGRIFHTHLDEMGNPIITGTAADCFGRLLDCFKEYEKDNGKFIYIHKDFKSKLFETFMKNSSEKQGMGQFFTPLKIVKEMIRMVDINEGMKICDPACGVGKFLWEATSKISEPFYFEGNELKSKITLVGFEKRMEDTNDDLTTILAKSNMVIYYSDLLKKYCDDNKKIKIISKEMLNKVITSSHKTLGTLEHLDFEDYDLILANPPYFQNADISKASKYITYKDHDQDVNAYTANGGGIEGLFTEWIVKSLKKGGVANVILPDGIFTNIGNNKLKKLIKDSCFIESIISLPINAFFTTNKKTYILTLRKRKQNETGIQDFPVYCYLCSSIGETLDSYRFDIPDNDLHNAVENYNVYRLSKKNEKVLEIVKSDKRCKLLDISLFKDEEQWNVERFWTENEKIDLGIAQTNDNLTLEEFNTFSSSIIDDVNDSKQAVLALKNELSSERQSVQLRITDLFTPKNGNSDLTTAYCAKHKGIYPVYSGNTQGEFAKIDSYDYEGEYLTWAKDGLAGLMMYHNEKFSLTGHRGILKPTEACKNIDLKYIKYIIEPIFRKNIKGRQGDLGKNEYTTLNSDMIKKMKDKINIPIKEDGSFDLEMQKEIASKYEQIEMIKKNLSEKITKLMNVNIV
ncbi:N-6 DNA methylase [Fibrobacter intestinalis]|uniref:site-specific DNA-methyltransferase (adenine-specific) n=1 Tax=Fibrobacter intestinalis TaxID=28122 RepID=A0A1T4RBC5_9BACT|nr:MULTISPECIES: N-6 DNA methylase [Fibrobacter]PBC73862.1 N-6 DNA methylase [Fibrobacter sp. NR9]SKA13324.1 N-6 DNA Methylase [Fibrobacter intestinalis]